MWLAQLTPGDAQAWGSLIEKIGVLTVLVLFILGLVRKWFAPWYVVEMKDARIKQLEDREERLLALALKSAAISEAALQQQTPR